MAAATALMVKELRDRTGLGMMECKKALAAADGDIDAAIEEMRKNSGMKAAKKRICLATLGYCSINEVRSPGSSERSYSSGRVEEMYFQRRVVSERCWAQP